VVRWSWRPFYPTLDDVARGGAISTSTTRALRVVEAVAAAGDGVTAKVIARRLGIPLPSVYRALGLLVQEGYLVRLHEVRGYGLGYRLADLYRSLTDQVRPSAGVQAVVRDLHTSLGAAAYLAVLRDTHIVIAHVDDCPDHPRPVQLRVGHPTAAHTTAAGKAVLANLPPRKAAGLIALVDHDRSGRALIERDLSRIRAAGTAVEVAEFAPGTAGIAAPVGYGTSALGIALPYTEYAARSHELERGLQRAAAEAACADAAERPASRQ
jgi:IclR family transcriptional regulator, acetate operon repressor